MKADLANFWELLCIFPTHVPEEHRNKYVACLLGDEELSAEEFEKLAFSSTENSHCNDTSCKWRFNGACFHPFRPGGLIETIFSHIGKELGDSGKILSYPGLDASMESRKCEVRKCEWRMPEWAEESAFRGVADFYRQVIFKGDLSIPSAYYAQPYEKVRERYTCSIDEKPFFPQSKEGCCPYSEDEIRTHFEEMMHRHYDMLLNAGKFKAEDGMNRTREGISKALDLIRLDLLMHWKIFWATKSQKKEERT